MNYIGIDNGVTGSIALVGDGISEMYLTPVYKEQSYTKAKAQITRIDYPAMCVIFKHFWELAHKATTKVFIERPYVNPKGFKATASALRSLEATLIVVESMNLPYEYIDSRQWQRVLLPSGIKGTADLKKASMDIGLRLFPKHKDMIKKQKDADGLLIAEWARREGR